MRRLSLDKPAKALPEVIDAIVTADTIIVGPGSIFTSVVPNFLVSGVREAFRESRGRKIYICNIMTQPGESEGFSLGDHVEVVEDYCGEAFDMIFWTEVRGVEASVLKRYREKGSSPVENDMLFDRRVKVIDGATTELIDDGRTRLVVRHSRNSILSILHELCLLGESRI